MSGRPTLGARSFYSLRPHLAAAAIEIMAVGNRFLAGAHPAKPKLPERFHT